MAQERRLNDMLAVKANTIIQDYDIPFTAQQQKILLYLLTQIDRQKGSFEALEVPVSDFCRASGIALNGGKNYVELKAAIKDFSEKKKKTRSGRKVKEEALIWFKYIRIDEGKIFFQFNDMMIPFLLQLKGKFTEIEFDYVAKMGSKYGVRLYEVLYSYYYDKRQEHSIIFPLNELQEALGSSYPLYANFAQKVLKPALSDINQYTDIQVDFETIKEGKKVVSIKFIIRPQTTVHMLKITGILDDIKGKNK